MTKRPTDDWSDERIIDYIREWAIQRWNCGRDGYCRSRINTERLFPCAAILKKRGPGSLAKLLPLLGDDNRDVRLAAASFAYAVDTAKCRTVLEELMQTADAAGFMAWASLYVKDPTAALDVPWAKNTPPP